MKPTINNPIERIFIQHWLELKPYKKQVSTDNFYLKVCNKVKQAILTNNQSFVLQIYLDKEELNTLSCFLTSYLEDVISDTNIWNAFIKHHTELYHKPLPFFDVGEYYEDEINLQDVCFLLWYFLNTIQLEKFISPFNDFIVTTARKVYDVFDEAWDASPKNEVLNTYYTIDEKETDFYKARHLIDNILFNSYLFYSDTLRELRDGEQKIINENLQNHKLLTLLNENRDHTLHHEHTRLLGLRGKEWTSKILGKNHLLYADFPNISEKIRGYFQYKGQDHNDIYIEHIASGKKFNLTKKSFDHSHELKDIDTIMFMGIVRWRNEWWFSGVYFQKAFNADLILDEKNSMESRMAVNFLDHQEKDVGELLEKQFIAFKDFTNGHQIEFVESDKINDFIKKYIAHFNDSLKLPKEEYEKASQRARADGFFGGEEILQDFPKVAESGLIFFNPNSGAEIALEVNSAFPLPNNPFFNKNDSEDHVLRLFMAEGLSKELAMFCVDNCKSALPFFNEKEGKLFLADIDFLLRFWKKNGYFSKPSITFTGNSE